MKKKRLTVMLAVLLAVSSLLPLLITGAAYAASGPIGTAVCTAKTVLNLRSGPGTTYAKTGSLPGKTKVDVYEKSGDWYKIKYNGKLHWASGSYLAFTASGTPSSTAGASSGGGSSTSATIGTAVCTAKTVMNLRKGPGTTYAKTGTLPGKASVNVYERSGNWYKIQYNGKLHWASGDYLKVTLNAAPSDTATPKPTATPAPTAGSSAPAAIGTAVCTAKTVMNLRSGPGTSYAKTGSLPGKASVNVYERSGNWYKISYNGAYHWASGDYLKVTLEPTPTATPPASANGLKRGSTGDAVKKLQQRLIALGYMPASASATGTYDEKTEHGVRLFERQSGLYADGVADDATLALLHSDKAGRSQYPLAGIVIGLDPGHQKKANYNKEPNAPGSSVMKAKVSSGTQGVYTKTPEYEVNLQVGLKLKRLLEGSGAIVKMTRETNDVNISNVERSQFFNAQKTDYALRLHCNGSENTSRKGAFILVPKKNPYLADCNRAAQLLIANFCSATGANSYGITVRDDQTGFNWCERMIIAIEMGHMSNKSEDILLASDAYQDKMAKGLYNGIVAYFK